MQVIYRQFRKTIPSHTRLIQPMRHGQNTDAPTRIDDREVDTVGAPADMMQRTTFDGRYHLGVVGGVRQLPEAIIWVRSQIAELEAEATRQDRRNAAGA